MPHISVEYSANIEANVDMSAFCDVLRQAVIETAIAPTAGIRVRAFRADHCAIADGDPAHGFIDISMRLRAGRSDQVKQDATRIIFAAAETAVCSAMQSHSIALSFEMRDIDPDLSPKVGSIRDHMNKG